MSQPPLSPEPESRQSKTTVDKETQALEKTSNSFQAVLKAQSIKALRGTIRVLEKVVVELETQPPASTTPSFLDKLQMRWTAVLANIRSLLPENFSSKLSDTALTGIIAGIAALGVWSTSALLPGKPPKVASVPPISQVSAPTITTPLELTAPAAPEPLEISLPPEPQLVESTAPPEAKPEPSPTPPLELTPEQNLIASIENQIAAISDRYADGLIQSIQANFQGRRLIIKIGNDWYNLKQSQQDKLAARMLERGRELDFTHLEITDPEGTLLARTPVVGIDMVILKRQVLSDQEAGVSVKPAAHHRS